MLQSREAYNSSRRHAAAGACSRLRQSDRLSFPRDRQAVAIIHVLYSLRNSDRRQHLCSAAFSFHSISTTTRFA